MDKEIIKLQNTKAAIKQALVDKGCNPTDEFASYADNIRDIKGEDPFLALGYSEPDALQTFINNGLEFKKNYNPNNTMFEFGYDPKFLPVGIDTSKAQSVYQTEYLLYVPRIELPNLSNGSRLGFSNAYFVELGVVNPSSLVDLSFGTMVQKIIINEPIKLKNSSSRLFQHCYNLKQIVGVDKLIVSNISSYSARLFDECNNLEGELDLRSWDTVNFVSLENMFSETKLNKIDISTWNTVNVLNSEKVFYSCSQLEEIVLPENFGINSTKFDSLCSDCKSLNNIDLNKINVSNAIDLDYMFSKCNGLQNIDISNWDISKVTTMDSMFQSCINLETLIMPETNPNVTDGKQFNIINGCFNIQYIKVPDNANYSIRLDATQNNLLAIDGIMSLVNFNGTYQGGYNLYKQTLRGLGTLSSTTYLDFQSNKNWGIEDQTILITDGARKSLVDSLISYSLDRASAGYSVCNIKLSIQSKALLTQDEIAQITAKGYTLV